MSAEYGINGLIPAFPFAQDGRDVVSSAETIEAELASVQSVLGDPSGTVGSFAARFFAMLAGTGGADGDHNLDGSHYRAVLTNDKWGRCEFGRESITAPGTAGTWSSAVTVTLSDLVIDPTKATILLEVTDGTGNPGGYYQAAVTARTTTTFDFRHRWYVFSQSGMVCNWLVMQNGTTS